MLFLYSGHEDTIIDSSSDCIVQKISSVINGGADALRFTLVTGNAPGNDMRFYWERVEASRNFANKVWNGNMSSQSVEAQIWFHRFLLLLLQVLQAAA